MLILHGSNSLSMMMVYVSFTLLYGLLLLPPVTGTKQQQQQQQEQQPNHSTRENHPDRVYRLPGYPYDLPSRWYSGYIDYELNGTMIHTHYVYVEAEGDSSSGDDGTSTTPILYWSNGGPGASSLFGLLTELGPLLLSDVSLQTKEYANTGIPSPLYNPWSWNQLGSLLIFDAPAPVGFSYCDDNSKGNGIDSCLQWTDELASMNTYLALQGFYDKFEDFIHKPLYLLGESYAGIYIPTLARRILHGNKNSTRKKKINLKGFAVGDGCIGTKTDVCGDELGYDHWRNEYFNLLFLAGHHQLPVKRFTEAMKICGDPNTNRDGAVPNTNTAATSGNNQDDDDDMEKITISYLRRLVQEQKDDDTITHDIKMTPECKKIINQIKEQLGGLYAYSLYDDCTYRNGLLFQNNLHMMDIPTTNEKRMTSTTVANCGQGPVLEYYMKLTKVKEAFNIPLNVTFFEVDNAEGFNYTPTEEDIRPFYKEVISNNINIMKNSQNNKNDNLDTDMDDEMVKILVYNGDTDPAITSFVTEDWTSNLGYKEIESWRPWTTDHCRRMGGYVTKYEGNFHFLTIRGAGHMVPTMKPDASYTFLKAWLNDNEDDDYPHYDKHCTVPPPPELPPV